MIFRIVLVIKLWPEQSFFFGCFLGLFSINVVTVLYVLYQKGCLEQMYVIFQIVITAFNRRLMMFIIPNSSVTSVCLCRFHRKVLI